MLRSYACRRGFSPPMRKAVTRSMSSGKYKFGLPGFSKKVLDDYDKYLEGVWTEYQAFRGIERKPLPKPKRPPVVDPANRPPVVGLPEPAEPQLQSEPQDSPKRPDLEPRPAKPARPQVSFDFTGFP